jgi:hypothetical protein
MPHASHLFQSPLCVGIGRIGECEVIAEDKPKRLNRSHIILASPSKFGLPLKRPSTARVHRDYALYLPGVLSARETIEYTNYKRSFPGTQQSPVSIPSDNSLILRVVHDSIYCKHCTVTERSLCHHMPLTISAHIQLRKTHNEM